MQWEAKEHHLCACMSYGTELTKSQLLVSAIPFGIMLILHRILHISPDCLFTSYAPTERQKMGGHWKEISVSFLNERSRVSCFREIQKSLKCFVGIVAPKRANNNCIFFFVNKYFGNFSILAFHYYLWTDFCRSNCSFSFKHRSPAKIRPMTPTIIRRMTGQARFLPQMFCTNSFVNDGSFSRLQCHKTWTNRQLI